MTEQEFDEQVPIEEQNWETFGRMHDAVMEATVDTTKTDLTITQCKKLFLMLPESVQEDAIEWGFSDTCFGDNVFKFVQDNLNILKGVL